MKLSVIFAAAVLSILLISCASKEKNAILLADREAPMGWVYLRIYADSSFEFESSGMRNSDIYKGLATIKNDSIYFDYEDEIPKVGNKAIFSKGYINYTNGVYTENLSISVNKLK